MTLMNKNSSNKKKRKKIEYDFGTFRDHSWDIRVWQTMDHLFIILLTLKKPLKLFNQDYYYLDLTSVSMPGNLGGVQRYVTGYLLGKNEGEILTVQSATSIDDIPWQTLKDGSRIPMPTHEIIMHVVPEPNVNNVEPISIRVVMNGPIRTLKYWPDDGAFEVFEDALDFQVIDESTNQITQGYGTRQSGFRIGEYDPTKGGCG